MARVSALALVLAATASAATFTRDIAPIVYRMCTPCHRPGESGPFSLLTYQDLKKHARQIVAVTQSRFMPPWLPEPGYGNFEGERRLTDAQIALIASWVREGAPEGDPAALPPAPEYVEGWQLGRPDLVIQLPRPYTLRAGGTDVYRNFVFPVPVTETRYVKALEIRPGNPRAVHHANVLIDRDHVSRGRDGQDGEIGFPGMELNITSETFDPDGHFLFWKPGTVPFVEPAGMAWRVGRGTDLVLNMHLQPSGKPEAIQPSIGLYFSDKPPVHHPMLLQLEADGQLDIPPGAKDFAVSDTLKLPVDVDVLGVYPHAHYLGKDLRAWATLPDGKRRPLIHIPRWDQNWQGVYRYAKPVFLPAGTVISIRYTYDNSAENALNPNHPPKRVRAGDLSTDEMSHLWLQVLPKDESGDRARFALQEALTRAKLKKDSSDFSANYNLGAVLSMRGEFKEAIPYFRSAVRKSPGDATAQNALGAALAATGDTSEALASFEAALRHRPDYLDAEYNLASALMSQNRFDEAVPHLERVHAADATDAPVKLKLAAALEQQAKALALAGQLEQSITRFQRALEFAPGDADLLTNTGTALARAGRLREAAELFERALRIHPGHPVAERNLNLVRQQLR